MPGPLEFLHFRAFDDDSSCPPARAVLYQGTASAQYCSLKQGDADCEVDTLRLVASPDYWEFRLIALHAAPLSVTSAGDYPLLQNLMDEALVQRLSTLRGE